jgi:4-aminobutyrate aminotransferase, mitochondrial
MLSGGFYYQSQLRPDQAYRIFNTWLGDPSKLVLLEKVIQVIRKENLLEKITKTGQVLMTNLKSLEKRYPNLISKVRGRGTFCAFDFATSELRNKAISLLHLNGIHCGGSGVKSLRIRTSLTFNTNHVNIFIDRLNRVLSQL